MSFEDDTTESDILPCFHDSFVNFFTYFLVLRNYAASILDLV